MNAKDLILKRVNEAAPRPPRRPPGPPAPGGGGGDSRDLLMGVGGMPDDMPGGGGSGEEGASYSSDPRMPGGPGHPGSMRPRGPFSPQEMTALKEVLLLIATEVSGNDFDGAIARKLIGGGVPDSGELQHILDEAGRIKDLPEVHGKLMQKVYEFVQGQR